MQCKAISEKILLIHLRYSNYLKTFQNVLSSWKHEKVVPLVCVTYCYARGCHSLKRTKYMLTHRSIIDFWKENLKFSYRFLLVFAGI